MLKLLRGEALRDYPQAFCARNPPLRPAQREIVRRGTG
jgi:hypothetical protein